MMSPTSAAPLGPRRHALPLRPHKPPTPRPPRSPRTAAENEHRRAVASVRRPRLAPRAVVAMIRDEVFALPGEREPKRGPGLWADANTIAAGVLRDLVGCSLIEIAGLLGLESHSTAIDACRRWEALDAASRAVWHRLVQARVPRSVVLDPQPRTFEGIVAAVAQLYDAEPAALATPGRVRGGAGSCLGRRKGDVLGATGGRHADSLRLPRMLVMWVATTSLGMSPAQIGPLIGHAPDYVANVLDECRRLMRIGEGLREEAAAIEAALTEGEEVSTQRATEGHGERTCEN